MYGSGIIIRYGGGRFALHRHTTACHGLISPWVLKHNVILNEEQESDTTNSVSSQSSETPRKATPSGALNHTETSSDSDSDKSSRRRSRGTEVSRSERKRRRERRDRKKSYSRRRQSRSHSRHRSRHRHPSRRHRHRSREFRHRSGRHRRDPSSHYHRKNRRRHHRSSSSSSSEDDHGYRHHPDRGSPVHGYQGATRAVYGIPKHAHRNMARSSSNQQKDSKKAETSVTTNSIPATTVTVSSASVASGSIGSATATNAVPRLNAQEILNQIQKHQEAQAKAQAIAAAAAANLPKYYNPTSVNPIKLAEQQQKRKLLWSKKEDENGSTDSKTSLWTKTSIIAGKGDTAAAAKFRKLMGIHEDPDKEHTQKTQPDEVMLDADTQKSAQAQAELFKHLEEEYEMSRALTHTQRGVGLGFTSATHVDYSAYSAMQSEPKEKQI
ncbi:unnamed protein product [Calicophoron daubneyi]|uniref:Small acidic protein-like domain-containing protein n=1 Tax=Calicophoron daubneyi TaxID=300641 RepID=A0AAV2TBC1_CALDB